MARPDMSDPNCSTTPKSPRFKTGGPEDQAAAGEMGHGDLLFRIGSRIVSGCAACKGRALH